MTSATAPPARTFALGGELTVRRLGYGAMRLTGPSIWGDPPDRDAAIRLLRRAVELGVNLIDTADCYGPHTNEELIRDALHPYPSDVVIATKGGLVRPSPTEGAPVGRPAYLRQQVEMSLRRLGLEQIGLYQLHRVDPEVPLDDQIGALKQQQDAGKIRFIGLSEVSVPTIEAARKTAAIATVQNQYSLADRHHEEVVDYASTEGIGFMAFFPVGGGRLARPGGVLDSAAAEHAVTPAQLALAWLLRRSPVTLPIPGTQNISHLEENIVSADVELTDAEYRQLSTLATPGIP